MLISSELTVSSGAILKSTLSVGKTLNDFEVDKLARLKSNLSIYKSGNVVFNSTLSVGKTGKNKEDLNVDWHNYHMI